MTTESIPTTNIVPDFTEVANHLREQIVTGVKAQHAATLEAVESLTKAAATASESFPTPSIPAVPGLPVQVDLKAITTEGFDFAAELLTAQRDFALQLISALTPTHVG